MAYIGKTPVIGNFVKLDAISVVDGQAAYTMQNGGVNFTSYDNVNQFLVSLNGILQSPTDSFTVSGSTLTFASNLSTGDVIDFVMVLGNTLDVGTPSDNTVSLAKLTATGTKDATTFLRGDNTFAAAGGGITEADQWRLAASITSDTDPISANLERVDDATFSKIGTGMSVSSGHWTFPSTGLYYVNAHAQLFPASGDNLTLGTHVSSDSGSSYDLVIQTNFGSAGGQQGGGVNNCTFVNVTNASTFRIKFSAGSFAAGSELNANTNFNFTNFTFIRLGDSQ